MKKIIAISTISLLIAEIILSTINVTAQSWTQKADFMGTGRADAVGFSIGTKGYVGTGWDDAGISYKEFW